MKELLEEKSEGKIEPLRLESEVSITAADVLRLEGLVEFE